MREGYVVICRTEECVANALELAANHPGARREDIEVVRSFLGAPNPPARFRFMASKTSSKTLKILILRSR